MSKLSYLYQTPKTIYWRVTAPENARLSVLQDHDLIYDQKDLDIRKIDQKIGDLK